MIRHCTWTSLSGPPMGSDKGGFIIFRPRFCWGGTRDQEGARSFWQLDSGAGKSSTAMVLRQWAPHEAQVP
eukprot:4741817-Amphidinium_carterae.1